MLYRIQNGLSEREIDSNGYLFVKKSPILKAGVLEYYGAELLPENSTDNKVDGVEVDPNKVYKVFLPDEEVEKGAPTFKLKPLVDGHIWLGSDGDDAKDYQEGSIGENVYYENGMIYAPLMFTGEKIIREIQNHEKEELSSSYTNRFVKSDNPNYDFIARDIVGNHVALVDKGRCGSAVRVLNSNKGAKQMAKTVNSAVLELDGKRIDLDRFFSEEKDEKENGADVHEDSISENEDKREVIREIMAVAAKNPDEFEGGDDEKVREIAKLAEKLAYKPSETSDTDNGCKTKNEDKRAVIDEIGGILKGKVDEELWRTVIKKAEELAYEGSEASTSDNEDKDEGEKDDKPAKAMNFDAVYAKVSNAIKEESAKAEKAKVKAYNAACAVVGDFNPFGMSEKDIYVKALNHLGVGLDGKESVSELSAMLKAVANTKSKVDNGFTYEGSSSEEREFNF